MCTGLASTLLLLTLIKFMLKWVGEESIWQIITDIKHNCMCFSPSFTICPSPMNVYTSLLSGRQIYIEVNIKLWPSQTCLEFTVSIHNTTSKHLQLTAFSDMFQWINQMPTPSCTSTGAVHWYQWCSTERDVLGYTKVLSVQL